MALPRLRRSVLAAAVLWLSLVAPCGAAGLAPDFTADFRVTRSVLNSDVTIASATLRLERGSDGGYRYSSQLWPVKLVAMFYGDELSEYARGRITPEGVRPDLYEMRLTGRRARQGSMSFDRERPGDIVLTQNFKGETTRKKVPPETLDRLSMQLAIAHDLRAGRESMQYLMADGHRLRVYRFEVKARERVETPVGVYDTIKVELVGRLRVDKARGMDIDAVETIDDFEGGDRTTFWLAPALAYLPVRVKHVDEDLGAFYMNMTRMETFAGTAADP